MCYCAMNYLLREKRERKRTSENREPDVKIIELEYPILNYNGTISDLIVD